MGDGSTVWVCKECGAEHQPNEAVVVDAASAQAAVNDAATAAPVASPAPTDKPL